MPRIGLSMAPAPGLGAEGPPAIYAVTPQRALTLLAVEDSRFAAEALRLMCRKLGVRLRRAEDLRQAERHLSLYRPDVVLVDLGLPDGRGEALIRSLTREPRRAGAVLATSGDPAGRAAALTAGADGFLDKPLESLEVFRAALVCVAPQLADRLTPGLPGSAPNEPPLAPDPLALRDDLARAAEVLHDRVDREGRRYLAGFLGGVARHAKDPALARAVEAVSHAGEATPARQLETLLEQRLSAADAAFSRPGKGD